MSPDANGLQILAREANVAALGYGWHLVYAVARRLFPLLQGEYPRGVEANHDRSNASKRRVSGGSRQQTPWPARVALGRLPDLEPFSPAPVWRTP